MSNSRLGRRGLERLRDDLTGRDHAIVAQVADLKLMSARQIEAIHFAAEDHDSLASASRCCRRVLERLTRDRLLIRLARRVGGVRAGSASFIYALGPVGQRLRNRPGPRIRFREPSTTFATHTLAITQVITELALAARSGRGDLLQLQPEPACWRSVTTGLGAVNTLRPDLFVNLGVGDFERRWFVELDLGTEHLPTVLRRCQAYEAYYRSGREQAEHRVFPRVLWIMHTAERAARLREAIDAGGTSRSGGSLTSELFAVTTTDQAIDTLIGVQR